MKNTTATPWIQHPRFLKILYPTLVAVAMVLLWQGAVSYFRIPAFLVPSPLVMLESLWTHLTPLLLALLFTLKITLISFLLSIVIGAAVAFILVQNRFVETALFPYIVFLQVTPIVAIAPLIIIWVKDATTLAGGVRHPDGGVSHHLQYHSGTAQRLPRPAELFSPQSRQPLANAGAAAYPLGAALFLRRAAYFQWAVADWRGGGGVCRRDRRDQYRTGLSDPAGWLPAGYPADVCRAAADLSRRYRAVWRDVLGFAPGA